MHRSPSASTPTSSSRQSPDIISNIPAQQRHRLMPDLINRERNAMATNTRPDIIRASNRTVQRQSTIPASPSRNQEATILSTPKSPAAPALHIPRPRSNSIRNNYDLEEVEMGDDDVFVAEEEISDRQPASNTVRSQTPIQHQLRTNYCPYDSPQRSAPARFTNAGASAYFPFTQTGSTYSPYRQQVSAYQRRAMTPPASSSAVSRPFPFSPCVQNQQQPVVRGGNFYRPLPTTNNKLGFVSEIDDGIDYDTFADDSEDEPDTGFALTQMRGCGSATLAMMLRQQVVPVAFDIAEHVVATRWPSFSIFVRALRYLFDVPASMQILGNNHAVAAQRNNFPLNHGGGGSSSALRNSGRWSQRRNVFDEPKAASQRTGFLH